MVYKLEFTFLKPKKEEGEVFLPLFVEKKNLHTYFNTGNLCILGVVLLCGLNPLCFNLRSFIVKWSVGVGECLSCLVSLEITYF